jgi:hypothetical protein
MPSLQITPVKINSVEVFQFDNVAFFGVANLDGRSIVHIEMDPATAAALMELGKALIAKIGMEIFKKLLGGQSIDLEALFRELIIEIADVIKSAIDENEVRLASSDVEGLILLMREYANATNKSEARLDFCVSQSALVVKRLENLLPTSANAYIFGVFLRLTALQEKFRVTQDAGEEQNVRDYAAQALPKVLDAYKLCLAANQRRVSAVALSVTDEFRGAGPGILGPGDGGGSARGRLVTVISADYTVDGVPRHFGDVAQHGAGDAAAASIKAIADAAHAVDTRKIEDDFMSRVGISIQSSIGQLQQLTK